MQDNINLVKDRLAAYEQELEDEDSILMLQSVYVRDIQTLMEEIATLKVVHEDHRRLVRDMDIEINGEGAAIQASLCDIVSQVIKINTDNAGRAQEIAALTSRIEAQEKVIAGLRAELKSHMDTEGDNVAKLSHLTALVDDDERAKQVVDAQENLRVARKAVHDYRVDLKGEMEK